MGLLPDISNVSIYTKITAETYPTTTYYLDKESMQLRSYTDLLPAMRQAVEIHLSVERYKWQIYTKNFGTEWDGLIGEEFGYVTSEIKRRVTESLLIDDRITDVSDFTFTVGEEDSNLLVTFMVYTVYGNFESATEAII